MLTKVALLAASGKLRL